MKLMHKKLTPEQVAKVEKEMVKIDTPVRFLVDGQCLNICTGELMPQGMNVMYHPCYWHFTKETAKKIAKWLGVTAIFSE